MTALGDQSTDRALLEAVADGDAGALKALHDRHARWLAARLQRRCNDRELVAEVLQDTFVAAWKGARRYRGEGDVGAWLWGISIRRLISHLRSRPALADVPLSEADALLTTGVEETVLLGVEYGDLGAAMRALSPEFRAVIQATVLDGLSTKEAAQLLRVPEGTVKSRALRARRQMRKTLLGGAT